MSRPIRVYTIAKGVGAPSQDIIDFLHGRGITTIKTPSSIVPDELAVFVGRFFSTGKKSLSVPRTAAEDGLVNALGQQLRKGTPVKSIFAALVLYVERTGGGC